MGLASDGKDVFFTIDNGGGSVGANVSPVPMSGKTHLNVLSESVTRITLDEENGLGVQLVDWFRPLDYQGDEGQDIGSGGFAVLDEAFKTLDGKRLGVATSKNSKMYIQDLDNLGGYRQGFNGSDGVLQTTHLDGGVVGGIGPTPSKADISTSIRGMHLCLPTPSRPPIHHSNSSHLWANPQLRIHIGAV
jgi:hypothetical protein